MKFAVPFLYAQREVLICVSDTVTTLCNLENSATHLTWNADDSLCACATNRSDQPAKYRIPTTVHTTAVVISNIMTDNLDETMYCVCRYVTSRLHHRAYDYIVYTTTCDVISRVVVAQWRGSILWLSVRLKNSFFRLIAVMKRAH